MQAYVLIRRERLSDRLKTDREDQARDLASRGSFTVNVEPLPMTDETSIVPAWLWTMPRLTERPRPVPETSGLVVKNGSKIRETCSCSMPVPVSVKATCTKPSWTDVRTVS